MYVSFPHIQLKQDWNGSKQIFVTSVIDEMSIFISPSYSFN
jgi:hypothetical protein